MLDEGTPELVLHEAREKRHQQLQVALIDALNRDFGDNAKTLTRIRWLVAFQALIVLLEIVVLLLGFYELT